MTPRLAGAHVPISKKLSDPITLIMASSRAMLDRTVVGGWLS